MSLERLAALLPRPLTVADVGCRDIDSAVWDRFGPHVRVVGFDPDEDECKRLQEATEGPGDHRFVPVALGAEPGTAKLHVTRLAQSSSLYEPDPRTIALHPQLVVHEPVGEAEVTLDTLDRWLAESGEHAPDFLKVDVQGAELDVLRGATRALETTRVVEAEVEFQALYLGQPLFADVDAHLRAAGFVLWRLRGLRHLSIDGAPPARDGVPMLAEDVDGHPSGGQLSWADGAIYVKADMARPSPTAIWTDLVRDACVAAALGLRELAELALTTAIERAPASAHGQIAAARAHLDTNAAGNDAGDADAPGDERDAIIATLIAQRDAAQREIDRLKPLAAPLAAAGPVARYATRSIDRARHWTRPRLGVLRQHGPTPLLVPRRQLRVRPPRNAPSIAIVTPSYNQGRFVERTIQSVLGQSYPALQYVVQDGGSSDETPTILERYRGQLAGCVSEPDGGQADAINRGFEIADGEIMGWLNSDDMLLPGALAVVARHFAEHPETDVVYGNRVVVDEQDRQVGCWILPPHEDWPLLLADLVPQETMFWRRSAWQAVGGLDPSYEFALDWDLLLRFLESGARMVRLPYMIGAFRLHDDQKSSAMNHVGLREMRQLLARHSRATDPWEAWGELTPYLRRHVAHHTAHRLARRVPGLHAEVTIPGPQAG